MRILMVTTILGILGLSEIGHTIQDGSILAYAVITIMLVITWAGFLWFL